MTITFTLKDGKVITGTPNYTNEEGVEVKTTDDFVWVEYDKIEKQEVAA